MRQAFRGKAQYRKTRASFRRELGMKSTDGNTAQKQKQYWKEELREARAAEQKKTGIATQLTIQLMEEYNEDKKIFRKKQSPKVNRLLRQFKSIYEANYGAEACALAARDDQQEMERQERVFGFTSDDFKQEDLKA